MSSELDKSYILNPGVRVFKKNEHIIISMGSKEINLSADLLDWELFLNLLFQEPQSKNELAQKLNCNITLIEDILQSLKNLDIISANNYYTSAKQFNIISKYGNFFFPLHSESYTPINASKNKKNKVQNKNITLPPPSGKLLSLMSKRSSQRDFDNISISLSNLSNLLFSTLGIVDKHRLTPSAGGLYPLSIFFIALNIESLKKGLYKYIPDTNEVFLISSKEVINCQEIFNTTHINFSSSSIIVFIFGNLELSSSKYGERAYRYLLLEAGHCAQNLSLTCIQENLEHVCIGGFFDDYVTKLFKQNENLIPLYSLAIGKKAK